MLLLVLSGPVKALTYLVSERVVCPMVVVVVIIVLKTIPDLLIIPVDQELASQCYVGSFFRRI